jgi:arsenate reductase
MLHWSFPDPSKATGSEDEQLAVYRQVRDAIKTCVQPFVESQLRR